MDANQFYQSRREDWQQLSDLLDKSQGNLQQLSPEEVKLLGALYRAVTSDLALAKRDFPRHNVAVFLNQLVARAHAVVYQGEPLAFKRMIRFVSIGFPRIFRELFPFTLVAALSFLIPALISSIAINYDPDISYWMLPAEAQALRETIENQELWTNIPIGQRPYASSFIMTNNIRVSFLAFGAGILVGVFTLWVMIFNGLNVGGLLGLTAHYDVGFDLFTFMIGHGVIELTVIFMAGGAGLYLGWAILRPGLLRRRDALTQAARKSVRLVIMAVPLLIIAGLIEGFISPSEVIPWPVKWGVGIGTGVVLYSYLFLAGRKNRGDFRFSSSP